MRFLRRLCPRPYLRLAVTEATDRLIDDLRARAFDELTRPWAEVGLITDSTMPPADGTAGGDPSTTNPQEGSTS